jgi:hypothetical protein
MTKPQQYYHAIVDYADEVNNGGHRQYFYNSYSDIYEVAIEGLKAIGAPAKAAILSGAVRAFSPGRPGRTMEERRVQMVLFESVQGGLFSRADADFYQSEERPAECLDVLLSLYALQHLSDFPPVPAPSPKGGTFPWQQLATKPAYRR